jgi:hypothetical protein
VDAEGRAVLDPTKNVLDLVQAAILRQDDLRGLTQTHAKEMAALRADYDEKLRRAETARIDAIRAVDVGQVQRAAEVQSTAAITLATQVSTSAETLRTQVAASASAAAESLRAAMAPILEAISALQKAQYETQGGKTQVAETRDEGAGRRQYVGLWIAAAALGASVILGIAGVVITLLLKAP